MVLLNGEKNRNKDNELTDFRNGDRFVFAKGPILPIKDRNIKIGAISCRLFHDGQFKPHCRLCKVPDHETGDIKCPMGNNGENIMSFRSYTRVFSNFFPCEINVFNNTFNSAEHAYK